MNLHAHKRCQIRCLRTSFFPWSSTSPSKKPLFRFGPIQNIRSDEFEKFVKAFLLYTVIEILRLLLFSRFSSGITLWACKQSARKYSISDKSWQHWSYTANHLRLDYSEEISRKKILFIRSKHGWLSVKFRWPIDIQFSQTHLYIAIEARPTYCVYDPFITRFKNLCVSFYCTLGIVPKWLFYWNFKRTYKQTDGCQKRMIV